MAARRRTYSKSALESYRDLIKDFQEGRFQPIYLFYGEESFLPDQLQKVLIQRVLPPEDRDFNLDVIQGEETTAQSVVSMCRTAPMLAQRRVVVIRAFDRLKNNKLFASLAKQPNPAAIVMLICEGRPKFNTDPYRALKRNAKAVRTVEFTPLWRNQAAQFVRQHTRSQGYDLEGGVEQLLVEFLGTGLASLTREIDKLITYVGLREPKVITRQDILQASGQTREINVFELQDAVTRRNAVEAHRIAEQLLLGAPSRQGEVLRIVAVLSSYFIRLWKIHQSQGTGLRQSDLAKQIGVSPNMINRYHDAARVWSLPEVKRAIQLLLIVDSEIKGFSKRSPRLIMSLFIIQLLAEPLHRYTR